MSRADRLTRDSDGGLRSTASEAAGIAAFLRDLALRAERDPTFARQLVDALRASGLVPSAESSVPTGPTTPATAPAHGNRITHSGGDTQADPPPDPFIVLRAGGEPALRAALDGLDLRTLRHVVRAYHLDPNRVAARWTARERVIALIVDQVRARANHGRSFERV